MRWWRSLWRGSQSGTAAAPERSRCQAWVTVLGGQSLPQARARHWFAGHEFCQRPGCGARNPHHKPAETAVADA